MATVEPAFDVAPVKAPASPSRSRRRSLLVLLVLVAVIVVLLAQGLLHSLNYFETVDQAYQTKASIGTKVIRLEGLVKPGTVVRTSVGASFEITGSKTKYYVVAHGSPPQLFRANIPVVVVGHFLSATSSTFDSNQILVKHSATYIAAHPNRVKAPNGSVR